MRFLSTLFWVFLAVLLALFARANWTPVTIKLWNDMQADIKLPALLLIVFGLGFLPTWLTMRTRAWSHRRRVEALERRAATPGPEQPAAEAESTA